MDAQVIDGGAVPSDAASPMDASVQRPEDGGAPPPTDAGLDAHVPPPVDAEVDAGLPDAGIDAGIDAYVPPPVDSGPPPGSRGYLDRCGSDVECESERCVPDVGGTQFCTHACTADADCADGHLCGGGLCVPDDTGTPCGLASDCATGLCAGNPAAGPGRCTRDCTTSEGCPAGYACMAVSERRVCVDIERPCTGPEACLTGICSALFGCFAACSTATDCPRVIPELAGGHYECNDGYCWFPMNVNGSHGIGADCDPAGPNHCRSGFCAANALPTPMCSQTCTAAGNCPTGYGCAPDAISLDGTTTLTALICLRAGAGDLGTECSSAQQCDSALCVPPAGSSAADGRCSRLCMDGICPTGWACTPHEADPSIRLCVPPS